MALRLLKTCFVTAQQYVPVDLLSQVESSSTFCADTDSRSPRTNDDGVSCTIYDQSRQYRSLTLLDGGLPSCTSAWPS